MTLAGLSFAREERERNWLIFAGEALGDGEGLFSGLDLKTGVLFCDSVCFLDGLVGLIAFTGDLVRD